MSKFRFLTSGESHGKCLTAIIEGIPSGFDISIDKINKELKRRQSGYGRGTRMKIETDTVEITSGVRFGKTLGSPVTLVIQNKDYENWQKIMSVYAEDYTDEKSFTQCRPGHADFAGSIKYNQKDLRNILERSSARKTAIETAVGSVAKQLIEYFNIKYSSKIIQTNIPVGLGSCMHWDRKLDGRIAQAIMSIPAVKVVEIGQNPLGLYGSEYHDEMFIKNGKIIRKTNNAGGIEGGMTNGEPIIVKAVMKPIPTMKKTLNTVDISDKTECTAHFERSDTCAAEACCVVAEARIACILADELLQKYGGDNFEEIMRNFKNNI